MIGGIECVRAFCACTNEKMTAQDDRPNAQVGDALASPSVQHALDEKVCEGKVREIRDPKQTCLSSARWRH